MDPSPQPLGIWIICAAFVIGVIANLFQIFQSNRTQKREVSFTGQHASKEEVAKLESEITRVDQRVGSLEKSIVDNGEKRRVAIEGKVEAVRKELSIDIAGLRENSTEMTGDIGVMKGEMAMVNQNLVALSAQIDAIR